MGSSGIQNCFNNQPSGCANEVGSKQSLFLVYLCSYRVSIVRSSLVRLEFICSFFFNPADPQGITQGGLPGFPTQLDIFRRFGAKGFSDHRFRAPPAYTAQLPTLHQHRANNQYRTANQIQPTLRVSSSTQATLEQSPIQVLTELNVA